jgi:phage shock protein PspC (stress-responsive transcriptional regulator)
MVTPGRLRRRTEHRLVAGVAGGIADRLNASVGFVRVFFGLGSAFAPWLLFAYAAAALVIPPRGSDRPDWDNLIGVTRLGLVFGVPVLALSGGFIVNQPLSGPPGWWLAYHGVLVVGGAALLSTDYRRGRSRSRAEARAVVIGAIPVGGCFIALAAAMLLAPDVRWERFVPIAALVGAAVLLLSVLLRRPGAFLAPALLAVAIAGLVVSGDARLQGGLGDAHVSPDGAGDESIVARRAVGDLHVDLRRVTRGGRDATVEASVGVGSLRITLPRRVRVELDASVGRGRIDAFSIGDFDPVQSFDGRELLSASPRGQGPATPTIHLRASVGVGEIDLSGSGEPLVEDRS